MPKGKKQYGLTEDGHYTGLEQWSAAQELYNNWLFAKGGSFLSGT